MGLHIPVVTRDGRQYFDWLGLKRVPVDGGPVEMSNPKPKPKRKRKPRLKPDTVLDGPIGRIITATAATHRVRVASIMARNCTKHVGVARAEAMYLAREITGLSYPGVGAAFGRDHSTVMHAVKRVKEWISWDVAARDRVAAIRARLAGQS